MWSQLIRLMGTIISEGAAAFMIKVIFYPEEGGSRIVRKASKRLPEYTSSHPGNYNLDTQRL
jgi:hypothetical protein